MCVYIFAGRFQPFHNGHMQVFEKLCDQLSPTDTLVLGVISPYNSSDIIDKEFLKASEEHHLPDRNPWDVLVPLAAVSLIARSSVYSSQIITTLLPRPEYGWRIITEWFPQKRIWVIPMANEDFDEKKKDYFENLGDRVLRIKDDTNISGRELREFYKRGEYDRFVSHVPEGLDNIYFKEDTIGDTKIDFQKRAKNFENHSQWVKDTCINEVPISFFETGEIGDLLDCGGGTGYLSWRLYQERKKTISSISLVDISSNMLDEARKKHDFPVVTFNSSIETFCGMTTKKYDTILLRQVLHYVNDVSEIVCLLRNILKDDGKIYVGQFIVQDEESREWHNELMKDISKNRKRTFLFDELSNCFTKNGFVIEKCVLDDYEENIDDLFVRRVNNYVNEASDKLKSKMFSLATVSLKKKMAIRFENNNLFFKVKFCHLLVKKA